MIEWIGYLSQFSTTFDRAKREKFAEIAIDASLKSFYYDTLHSLHSLERTDKNINLETPLMISRIDVCLEQQPYEYFITHSKEVSRTMDEVPRNLTNFNL